MSNISIEVIDVTVTDVPKKGGGGTYKKMVVTYKDHTFNKVEGKQLFDFVCPKPVWEGLAGAVKGNTFVIARAKDKKENKYWEWVGIEAADALPATSAPTSTPASVANDKAVAVSTFAEKDKEKQLFIIRQSSIASAVNLCKDQGKQPDVEQVLTVAQAFVDFVVGADTKEIV